MWRPGDAAPGLQALSAERDSSGVTLSSKPPQPGARGGLRLALPIYGYRSHILYLLQKYATLVLVGETGCGKSTQVPQYLHEAGWTAEGRVVACLQPRRVAAVSVAQRVAEERGCALGQEVGYAIRFDDMCSELTTRIKYMTEGVLLREMMRDPLLQRYSVIMLDEAHERTVYLDIVVGLLVKVQRRRPDLRVIVSSATLDAEVFFNFCNHNRSGEREKDTATILSVEGRTYPVDVLYAEAPVPNYMTATVDTIMDIHTSQGAGDVLAFLTGKDEVEEVCSQLAERMKQHRRPAHILPMHGGLPPREQFQVFAPVRDGNRKVIVATNVAEASVTIPDIVYVVDCGFVKLPGYSPKANIESLSIVPVSKASADQRAGRAGRMRSGVVYRLYTEEAYRSLPTTTPPEMLRTEISPVVLQLKALGIDNVLRFPFVSPPPAQTMINALERLFALEALDAAGKLTEPLGLTMAEFPLPPMQARMLLASGDFGCSEEICIITAMLQVENIFIEPHNRRKDSYRRRLMFTCEEGDHITLLNVYLAFTRAHYDERWCNKNFLSYKNMVRAKDLVRQLRLLLKRFGVPLCSGQDDSQAILRCIVKGFFANAAKLHADGSYRLIRGDKKLAIHPGSVMYTQKPAAYVVFNEVILTSECFMRDISVVQPEWLSELAPHYYEYSSKLQSSMLPPDKKVKKIEAESESFRNLTRGTAARALDSQSLEHPI